MSCVYGGVVTLMVMYINRKAEYHQKRKHGIAIADVTTVE